MEVQFCFVGYRSRRRIDYSQIAHAFGFKAHEEVGRPPLRIVLAPNIKAVNEGMRSLRNLDKMTDNEKSTRPSNLAA